jgi:hypothetical protein
MERFGKVVYIFGVRDPPGLVAWSLKGYRGCTGPCYFYYESVGFSLCFRQSTHVGFEVIVVGG